MKRKWIAILIGACSIATPVLLLTFLVWIPQSGFQNHSSIEIIGDLAFTSDNGVTGGAGTPGDPFIIENWLIDGAGARDCITIINTSASFTIRNCMLLNQFKTNFIPDGIYLVNMTNGRVSQCQVYSVHLVNSNSTIIENNQVTNSEFWGIMLESSNLNKILGNSLSGYLNECISIDGDNNCISGNTCTVRGAVGIAIWGENNTVAQNMVSSMTSAGIRIKSSNNLIVNNTCSYNEGNGIDLSWSWATNNTVIGNTCVNNRKYGIELGDAVGNLISENTLFMNWLQGIQAETTATNNISDNNVVENFGWLVVILFFGAISLFCVISPRLLAIKQRNSKTRITQDLIFESIFTSISLFAILIHTLFYFDVMGIIEGLFFGIFGLVLCIRTWMGKGPKYRPPPLISLIIRWILVGIGFFLAFTSIAYYTWTFVLLSWAIYDTILYRQQLNQDQKQKARL